jgi:class 3 adenylate cyclase
MALDYFQWRISTVGSGSETFNPVASVAFFAIKDFERLAVAEQVRRRVALDRRLTAAIGTLAANERIVLETPGGGALVILDNPQGAWAAAASVGGAAGEFDIRVGIDHGPIRIVAGKFDGRALAGDALEVASNFAGYADAGTVAVSRSFVEALTAQSPQAAETFQPLGKFTDAKLRAHEVFARNDTIARAAKSRRMRRLAIVCGAILLLGIGARFGLEALDAARNPATLVFDIRPQGDIYVDGELKGKAPGLAQLQVTPGVHRVEVKYGKATPFVAEVNLKPGEQMHLKHSFAVAGPAKQRSLVDKLKFWQ